MASLVLELQRDAMDSSVPVSAVLRKALVVAAKLDLPEFRQLCEKELGGYGPDDEVPDYRNLRGQVKVRNPYQGWQPVHMRNAEYAQAVSTRPLGPSISELEELVRGGDDGTPLEMQLPAALLSQWMDQEFMQMGLTPVLLMSKTSVIGVIEKVRHIVLDWSLKLERDGILGDGMTFSPEEKQAAASVVYNIQNVTGVVGGSIHAANLQINSYTDIHGELKKLGIDQASRNELESIMDEIVDASPEDRPGLIARGLGWVERHKGTLGALATVLAAWISSHS